MNLQSLTILRACLEDAAFSGTDTVPADLRLREAADAFSARAAGDAAAVELAHTAQALFAASEDDRPALLLDALAAANAARCACAQTDVPGTLVPADGRGGYVPVSYSRLRLLTDALSGSGGARFSLLSDAWARFPAWFSDERVRPVLAAALGDPSEEMETLLATILTAQGKSAVPSLKDGFAPDGKREMVRRVYWVARLAGAEENAWLLSILPESRGEVREAVIAALGVSQDNASLLLALYHGEGGKCRDAALRALARMNDEDSRALWIAELERRADCPPCLEGVDAPLAADMAALVLHDAFSEALERERKELALAELLTLAHAVYAAYGKYSEALRQEWLFLAGQMDTLERICADRTVSQWDLNAAEMLEKCLLETVLWNPSEEVRALARELAGVCPAHFLSAAALIDILMRPAEAFDTYRRYIVKNNFLHKESAAERANRVQLMRALAAVRYSKEDGRHIPFFSKDALTGAPSARLYRLPQFDPRWAETLFSARVNQDGAVFDLCSPWTMTKRMLDPEWLEDPEPPQAPAAEEETGES